VLETTAPLPLIRALTSDSSSSSSPTPARACEAAALGSRRRRSSSGEAVAAATVGHGCDDGSARARRCSGTGNTAQERDGARAWATQQEAVVGPRETAKHMKSVVAVTTVTRHIWECIVSNSIYRWAYSSLLQLSILYICCFARFNGHQGKGSDALLLLQH
jgi:hypothetical protein